MSRSDGIAWHQQYADDGLVIIGVHTPEFNYEKDLANVKEALVRLEVPYPVAIDNNWQTWRAHQRSLSQTQSFSAISG